jgi:hypothetical protein
MARGLKIFTEKYKVKQRHGGLILYKAVCYNYAPWVAARPDHSAWDYEVNSDAQEKALEKALMRKYAGVYLPGTVVTCKDYDTDRDVLCGPGLHVGTLACAMRFYDDMGVIVECLVMPRDVICVPYSATNSWSPRLSQKEKIRCKRLQVLRDITDEIL